jgi:predicted kinase
MGKVVENMTTADTFGIPNLIVVTGRPASGKTTLAHALAKSVRCPVISRDEIKEGIVNTIENSGTTAIDDLNGYVYHVFFETIALLVGKSITLVIEAAFQHQLWAPKLEPLKKVARIRLIVCSLHSQLAYSRYVQRGLQDPDRAGFHDDWAAQTAKEGVEYLNRSYQPPEMDVPTLAVDTSNGYQPLFEEIVSFAIKR